LVKKNYKPYLFLIPVAGTIILLDQITKAWVSSNLALGEVWSPWSWLMPYARVVHWYNTGVAFGMLQGQNWFFAIFALIIAAAIFYLYPRFSEDWLLRLALAMQFGGAVGNLIDRFKVGHVIDFISIGNFAVFNVADASITVGVFIMALSIWRQEKQESRSSSVIENEKTENPANGSMTASKK